MTKSIEEENTSGNKENIDSNIFQSLFDNSMSAILYGNPDNGCILDANSAAATMFGYTIDELRKLNRNDVFDFNDLSMIEALKTRQKGGSAKGELIGIKKNGLRFPCEFTSSIFKNEKGENRTCTILKDISERRKSENEIKLLLNNTEESFVIVDLELKVISFNEKFANEYLNLLNVNVLKGEDILNLAQKERHKSLKEIYKRVFSGETIEDEICIPNKNTSFYYWIVYKPLIDNNGKIIAAFVTTRNVTAKKHAIQDKEFEQRNKEALINATNDLIWSVDKDFKLIAANQAFIAFIENSTGVKMKAGDIAVIDNKTTREFAKFWIKLYKIALKGKPFKYEAYTAGIGKISSVWYEVHVNPIHNNENVVGVACYGRNITDKKNIELKLKENNIIFEKLTTKIPAALYQFEINTDGKMYFPYISSGVKFINPAIDIQLLKTDASSVFSTVHPEDLNGLLQSIEYTKNNLTDWEFEYRSILSDGKIIWTRGISSPEKKADGTITWYGYLQNVTEQKKSLDKIRESKERYDIIAKATNDTIWDRDLKTNKIIWNKGIKGIYGYDENEMDISNSDWWLTKIHPDDIERVKRNNDEWIRCKKLRFVHEYRFLCSDNTYKYVYDRGFLVLDDENRIVRMMGAMQDITERKIAEEKLKTNEQQFRTIFEGVPACVKLMGLNGDLLEINKAGLKMLEVETIDQAKSQPLINYLLPQYQKSFVNIHNRTVSGENCVLEFEMLGLKGTKRWVETHTVPMKDSNNQIIKILAITQDVSHYKANEKALQESEIRYRTMIECSPEPIAVHSQGKIVFVNPTAIRLFGASSSNDLIGKSIFDIVHPDFHDMTYSRIKNTVNGVSNNLKDDYKLVMLDGTVKDIVSEATAIIYDGEPSVHIVMKDITKQKQEEHHLKLIEAVIKKTIDPVVITDSGENDRGTPEIVYVNEAFTKLFGFSESEVIGKSPKILRGAKSPKDELLRLKTAVKNHQPCEVTIINYTKDDKEIWVNLSISPIEDNEGKLTNWIAVQRDFRQKKRDEIEREHIITELSQNNKDLKQFSHVISHNLRSPIANLLGLTSLIDNYKVTSKTLKQILDGIKQAALMFDDTIKDLTKVLVIKDQTSIIKKNVIFVEVIDKVLKQLSISVNDNAVKINYEFKDAPFISFSESYAESILLNLFTNAIKYQSPKRKLKIDIITSKVGNFIELKFTDNGIGIDVETHKEKLFKLYQRFHDNPDGKGLGLYLIKSQIEALGGSIDVESEIGKGTTFILKFKNI